MDIENIEIHGQAGVEFTDRTGTTCTLWILENIKHLRFDLDTDFSQFSQEDIKTLLPYLEAYANNGTLQIRQEPLQGGSKEQALEELILLKDKISLEEQLEIVREYEDQLTVMQEAGVAMAANIVDQGKRIEELQELVRAWSNTHGCACSDCYPDLHKRTTQLLGENQ